MDYQQKDNIRLSESKRNMDKIQWQKIGLKSLVIALSDKDYQGRRSFK